MTRKRKRRDYIPLNVQLAAALRQIGEIPFEHARKMSADQIIALFHCDHGIFKTWEENPGEFDEHWNLTFRFIRPHREKTKGDQGIIAKVDRVSAEHKDFRDRLLRKAGQGEPAPVRKKRKAKIASRPFPKGHRPMRSRNTLRKPVPR